MIKIYTNKLSHLETLVTSMSDHAIEKLRKFLIYMTLVSSLKVTKTALSPLMHSY